MEQRLRKNEEYNLQVQEYYKQQEEQWDVEFAQQQMVLQVSMIVNNRDMFQLRFAKLGQLQLNLVFCCS
jgi:hypothetical protein